MSLHIRIEHRSGLTNPELKWLRTKNVVQNVPPEPSAGTTAYSQLLYSPGVTVPSLQLMLDLITHGNDPRVMETNYRCYRTACSLHFHVALPASLDPARSNSSGSDTKRASQRLQSSVEAAVTQRSRQYKALQRSRELYREAGDAGKRVSSQNREA
ncbi:hypothetical protein DPEC_G00100920 [Dallia pectoralis]|uniref:Uncharacterized protein n=1 Tax=Dallia pectoralis TaxID=75939 RepID=A0ACC2GX20_DALPE|nr:hypothetical protein DPEC_G00100920 [Dallia pectoralis]